MPAYRFFQLITTCIFILAHLSAFSQHNQQHTQQHHSNRFEANIDTVALKADITFLSDKICNGRSTGSSGIDNARIMILNRFKGLHLHNYNGYFTQSFKADSSIGRNIIGFIPSRTGSKKYIIIGAHYDNIGVLRNKMYPGADANASGTAALLALAKIFSNSDSNMVLPKVNIVFVAFDAKEKSLAGSWFLASHLPFKASEVVCMINLDQVGTSLAPPSKYPDNYLLVLGRRYLPKHISAAITAANINLKKPLKIDYTFYRSNSFHDTFYRLSDHYPFHKKGIPAIMFTAGINQNNYKTTDIEENINYSVMGNRILLTAGIIYRLAYR
jgi:hypothetical protein